jgi:hypothetical protein
MHKDQTDEYFEKSRIKFHINKAVNLIRIHGSEFIFKTKEGIKFKNSIIKELKDIDNILERTNKDFWKKDFGYIYLNIIIEESVKKVIKELKSREIIDLKDKIEKIESGLNNRLVHYTEYEREELNQKKDKLNKKLKQKMKEFDEEYKKSKDPEKNIETLIIDQVDKFEENEEVKFSEDKFETLYKELGLFLNYK